MGEYIVLVASSKLVGEGCVKVSQCNQGVIGIGVIELLNGGCEEVGKAETVRGWMG